MAKPAITKRGTKAAALTYNELDTNFQNLADATVSLTAGSGGTQVTADLNGNITLVAGTGITLSGDNTAKTLTITGTASASQNTFSTIAVSGQSNVVADSTTDTLTLIAGSNISLTTNATNDSVTINAPNVATYSGIIPTLTGTSLGIQLSVTGGSSDGLVRLGNTSNTDSFFQATGTGNLRLVVSGQRIIYLTGITQLKETTTTERDSITAADGMIIFNTTTNKFQGRAGGVWVDLH
jgi:hypothetical protein